MNQQHSRRVKGLFAQATDLPEKDRGAFLDAECGGDLALRAEVLSLLSYDSSFEVGARAENFLKSPLVVTAEGTQRAQEALKTLDPLDREVLILRHVEQLGRVEVAERLGISQEEGARR